MAQFSHNSARRVAEATRRTEQAPRSKVKRTAAPRISGTSKYAIVATEVSAAVRATKTLGMGTGTLQIVSYDSSGVATYASMGLGFDVPIYSGALSPIEVGRLVKMDPVDGRYHIDVDFC